MRRVHKSAILKAYKLLKQLMKKKVVAIECEAEFFMVDWYAKDFESVTI